jgi:hypothetical protein
MNHPDWQKCENCYSFVPIKDDLGSCRHNPPGEQDSAFPVVKSTCWCRQWSGMMLENGNSYMGPVTKEMEEAALAMKVYRESLSTPEAMVAGLSAIEKSLFSYPEQTLEPQNPA